MDLSSLRGRGRGRVVAGSRRKAPRRPSFRPAAGDDTAPAEQPELTEASSSVTKPTIKINDLLNFQKRLLDEADKNLNSPVEIDIRDRITDKEYDIIKNFIEETNDNLQRTALKIKTERLGKEVVGVAKGYLQSFRSAEKKGDQYKSLVGNEE